MTEEGDLERIEEWVNKGILLQRESKHKEAIACFDKAISLDENRNGKADSNLLLLKDNSLMKL
ncbi:tetratricopeptide repeat protein [Nitrosopumilus sp.]|jgi:tetratricopeptide (TPR) repeat protein|nr:tetratricopeptide repeat protein [Nitrosopumilus sp.]|tara:strand:- start:491 stop:679 length:189 start_codon:yes stop_codon:yes gene_type:complete